MKIVVISRSGLASPASGVDTINAQGLAEALPDAQVAVDVANSPSLEDQAFLQPNAAYSRIGRHVP